MYAIFDDRNQQYRVKSGDRLHIHFRKDAAEGATLTFEKVCAVGAGDGAEARIGTPFVSGAVVTAKVVRNDIQGPKVTTGKFRRRKNSRRKRGFRAQFTEIQIEAIQA